MINREKLSEFFLNNSHWRDSITIIDQWKYLLFSPMKVYDFKAASQSRAVRFWIPLFLVSLSTTQPRLQQT